MEEWFSIRKGKILLSYARCYDEEHRVNIPSTVYRKGLNDGATRVKFRKGIYFKGISDLSFLISGAELTHCRFKLEARHLGQLKNIRDCIDEFLSKEKTKQEIL